MEDKKKFIDVESVIKAKGKRLYSLLPRFIISYLKRIVHQDEINVFIEKNNQYEGVAFTGKILEEFNITVNIIGEENINQNQRLIIASNHPLGGLDGIALLNHLGRIKPVKAVINDILMSVANLKPLFVPVNKHGGHPKEYVKILNDTFDSDANILYFPAGLVSRKKGKNIMDLEWKKSFIQKAVRSKRDIVPCYVNGRNSNFFYNLANLRKFLGVKVNIEMLYLVNEMFKHRNNTITIIYGTPIPYTVFDKKTDDRVWAQLLRTHCYALAHNTKAQFMNNNIASIT